MAQQYELNLRDYFRIFRRRRVTIFIVLCVVSVFSYYYLSSRTPLYQSSIKVKIVSRLPVVGITYGYRIGDQIQTQMEIIKSRPVAERVAKSLGWLEGLSDPAEIEEKIQKVQQSIRTEQMGQASVIRITATALEGETARKIANAVAEAYRDFDLEDKGRDITAVRIFVEEELKKATEKLKISEERLSRFKEGTVSTERAAQLQTEIASLELKLQELLTRATPKHPDVERLQLQLDVAKEELKGLPKEELTFTRLQREVEDQQKLVSQLKQKYNEAVLEEAENVTDVVILEEASRPAPTFHTNKRVGFALSVVMGLLLGSIVAFFKEGLDTSFGVIEEVESFLGVGVLGVIPHMPAKSKKRGLLPFPTLVTKEEKIRETRERLVAQFNPRSPEAESYHTLRTAIYSVLPQKEKLAIAISSTGPREGKSLTCANLAVTSAQMGKKTLLIDADFRRPTVHDVFGLDRIPGLFEILTKVVPYPQALKNVSDLLIGDEAWREALKSPHLGYLSFLTSGHLPSNPPELFDSPAVDELIRSLLTEFDFLIFDCPPILPVTDSLILAPKLDGVILVYQSGRTARNALKRAKMQLETAQAKLLGVVFNDVRPIEAEPSSAYYYRYRKYYSEEVKGKAEEETS